MCMQRRSGRVAEGDSGSFATNHSHINYYIDLTTLKARQNEAQAAARLLAYYSNYSIVDTIVCLDGCEVIGAYLAEELTKAGVRSINEHKTIYIATPEYHTGGQLIFRDNMQMMVRDKNILLLLATATTGKTLNQSIECIEYYGGKISAINAIFSAVDKAHSIPVNAIFTRKDSRIYRPTASVTAPVPEAGEGRRHCQYLRLQQTLKKETSDELETVRKSIPFV